MRKRAILAAGMAGAALAATGCSRLEVVSEPQGAAVLWSADGLDNWQPWPPRAWSDESASGEAAAQRNASGPATPLKDTGVYGDTVWITVQKDGYFRPLPRAAQLYALRREKLVFDLRETPDAYAARRQAEGFVLWRGEWVKPEDHGLAQFADVWMTKEDAFEREQIAKGLVQHAGEWMTREQAAARFADEQRAKGLVEFKNRWIEPAAKMAEEAIDAELDTLAATDPKGLALPRVIGPVEGTVSQLQVLNSTSRGIRFVMSGPQSREFRIPPYSSVGLSSEDRLRIEPGRYELAVMPQAGLEAEGAEASTARVAPEEAYETLYVEAVLAAGFQYLVNYDVESGFGEGSVDEYKPQEPVLPIEPPTIEIPEIELPQERPRRGPGGAGRQGGGMPGGMRPGGAEGGTGGQAPAGGSGQGGQPPRQREGGGQRPSGGGQQQPQQGSSSSGSTSN